MRCLVVSFACYHLWLHWRRPAVWLARRFVDFEPGIHFSQCQMQAGTAEYVEMRVYNPIKQAKVLPLLTLPSLTLRVYNPIKQAKVHGALTPVPPMPSPTLPCTLTPAFTHPLLFATHACPRPVLPPLLHQDQDPKGTFIRRWLPELHAVPTQYIAEPHKMPATLQRRVRCIIGNAAAPALASFGTTALAVGFGTAEEEQQQSYQRYSPSSPATHTLIFPSSPLLAHAHLLPHFLLACIYDTLTVYYVYTP
jgi:hypothetical protein